MVYSMTGFAGQESQHSFGVLRCELRCVNNRFLDVNIKLPERLAFLEDKLRNKCKESLIRGKLDCIFTLKGNNDENKLFSYNQEYITQVIKAIDEVNLSLKHPAKTSALDLLMLPGQNSIHKINATNDNLALPTLQLFEHTMLALLFQREIEGKSLKNVLQEKLSNLVALVANARDLVPQINERYKSGLRDKLTNLSIDVDDNRLCQEIILFINKTDITEELDRLITHIDSVAKILSTGGAIGRKLDFFMQELNREANTIASKSVDSSLTSLAVEMKVIIEQMREQIQNIE